MKIARIWPLVAFCAFSVAPALAHRAPAAAPATPSIPSSISDPCDLNPFFISLHTTIFQLDQEAKDTGNEALRISHTSLSRPYRDIERNWADVANRSWPIIQTLYDTPLDIDDLPSTPQKRAALQLNTAYQTALKQIMDYTRTAAYYERAENFTSTYIPTFLPSTLAFGVNSLVQMPFSSQSRTFFESKTTEPVDALNTLNYPEYRYAKICNAAFPATK